MLAPPDEIGRVRDEIGTSAWAWVVGVSGGLVACRASLNVGDSGHPVA